MMTNDEGEWQMMKDEWQVMNDEWEMMDEWQMNN